MLKELEFKKEIVLDSDSGLVYNTKTKRYIGNLDSGGYRQIGIRFKGKTIMFKVHRLMWAVFVGEIPEGYEIDHINGNRLDNRLSNLRCVTHQENCNNPITLERQKEASKKRPNPPSPKGIIRTEKNKYNISKGQTKPFIGFPIDYSKRVLVFYSMREAIKMGFSQSKINMCCNGIRNKHKDYIWCFL